MKRWRSLDGMRAFAVLTVFAYHLYAGPKATWDPLRPTGGFIGVDVFYVLSGFLITGLLLAEWDRGGRVDVRAFYARRALRLFPALAVVLIVAAAASVAFSAQNWSRPTLLGLPWVILYVGNWNVVAFGGGHSGLPLGVLGQTWSLSVEEQFYLFWPVILVLILRRRPSRRRLAQVLAGVAVADMVYPYLAIRYLHWAPRDRVFYGTDTHACGLILGCAVAVFVASRREASALPPRTARALSVAAVVAALGLAVVALRMSYTQPASVWFGIPVASTCAAVIVLNLVTQPVRPLAALLSWAPLAWIGQRSYGLYLWQTTVTLMLADVNRHGIPENAFRAGEVALVFLLAAISYRFVELPFLRRKRAHARVAVEGVPTTAPA